MSLYRQKKAKICHNLYFTAFSNSFHLKTGQIYEITKNLIPAVVNKAAEHPPHPADAPLLQTVHVRQTDIKGLRQMLLLNILQIDAFDDGLLFSGRRCSTPLTFSKRN